MCVVKNESEREKRGVNLAQRRAVRGCTLRASGCIRADMGRPVRLGHPVGQHECDGPCHGWAIRTGGHKDGLHGGAVCDFVEGALGAGIVLGKAGCSQRARTGKALGEHRAFLIIYLRRSDARMLVCYAG